MKYLIIICTGLLCMFNSCSKQESGLVNTTQNSADQPVNTLFAKVLAKAVEDENIRSFLRNESLKKFDNDYDVLYQIIKDKKLNNDQIFSTAISKYAEDPQQFLEALESNPLLTIYIPDLKNFGATSWNVQTQVPVVAVRDLDRKIKGDNIIAYNSKNAEIKLSYTTEPDIPVIVVKDNERIEKRKTDNTLQAHTSSKKMAVSAVTGTHLSDFVFLDSSFINKDYNASATAELSSVQKNNGPLLLQTTANAQRTYQLTDQVIGHQSYFIHPAGGINWASPSSIYYGRVDNVKLMTAGQTYTDFQRDYIYYNIKSNTDKGAFVANYIECINSISFTSDLSKNYVIDDQRDWTDGVLEIAIHVFFINKNGGLESTSKVISVEANEIFKNDPVTNKPRVYYLPTPIPIIEWDLYKYGDTWSFYVEEIDPGSVSEKNIYTSSSYSGNWEVSGGFSIFKIGVTTKASGSTNQQRSETINLKVNNTSDDLGKGILNYSDRIMNGFEDISPFITVGKVYTVKTGIIELGIVPKLKY